MTSCASSAANVVFVVNPHNKSEFSRAQLMQLYLRKTDRFSDGTAANLFHLPRDSAGHQQFCMGLLNLTANQYQSYWSRLLFTGNVAATQYRTEQQLISLIAADDNAIGYVSVQTKLNGLRAVAILRDRELEIIKP
jgi:hypothetical protein